MEPEMSQEDMLNKFGEMYEKGELTLEAVAIENHPHAIELIQHLIAAGLNPLKPNSKKLFPYHYSKCLEVFVFLTPPPIEQESFLVTLAR
jgi:hypothetical protein